MEWYKIVAIVWVASAAVRYVVARPAMKRQRDIMCTLCQDMGLTPRQMQEAGFLSGMRIVHYLEPLLAVVYTPYLLVKENVRFFSPITEDGTFITSVDLFRKMIYAEGTYVDMLEAYERRMNEEGERRFTTH